MIYTVAPSPLDRNVIWAGTDDGLIHVTRDGGTHWTNVTPPALDAVGKVSIIDASHFDAQHRLRRRSTRSGSTTCGRTSTARTTAARRWTEIVSGLPDGGVDQRRARRSEAPRPALRRHRAQVVSSRSTTATLAVAAAEHAGDVDPRPRHQGRRPRRRHARPRLLDPRRHHAAAAAHAGHRARAGVPVHAADGVARPLEQEHRHAAAARRARRAESARRRVINYLLAAARRTPVDARDHRTRPATRFGATRATIPPEAPVEGRNIPDYWIRPAQRLRGDAGAASLRLGPALRAARRSTRFAYPIAAVAAEHAADAAGHLRAAGHVSGAADRGRPVVPASRHRADGSAREDVDRGPDAAVHAVEGGGHGDAAAGGGARARSRARVAAASGEAATRCKASPARSPDAFAPLQALFESLQEADARPTPALEAAVKEALARANAAVAQARTPVDNR